MFSTYTAERMRSAALIAAVFGLAPTTFDAMSFAAVVATDAANNSAYAAETGGAWMGLNPLPEENPAGSDDGGVGFKPWSFAGGYHYPQQSPYGRLNHFIDGVDFAASTFNNLGAPAFALTNANVAFGGATTVATRAFEAPLTVGGSVSFRFDNPSLLPLANFDEAGFVIRLNEGGGPKGQAGVSERFAMYASSGFLGGGWVAADLSGDAALNLPTNTTRSGAEFRFTLTAAESYRLDILPLAGGSPLATRNGSLKSAGSGPIDAIEILMYGNGSGNGLVGAAGQRSGEREFFFNSLAVTTAASAGDYDGDGDVDGADFLVWQRTLGSKVILGADGNKDGTVNAADLSIWRSGFNLANLQPMFSATPEPNPLAMLLLPLCLIHKRRSASDDAF